MWEEDQRNVGLPSAELAPDKVPSPGALPLYSRAHSSRLERMTLLPGRGEGPGPPRERQAAKQEVGQNRLECLSYVPCPTQEPRGRGCHPRALQAELPGRGRVRLSGMSKNTRAEAGQGQEPDSLNPMGPRAAGSLGLGQRGRADRTTGHMLRLTCQ